MHFHKDSVILVGIGSVIHREMKKLSVIALLFGLLLHTFAYAEDSITFAELNESNSVQSGFIDILHEASSGKTYLKIDNVGEEFIYMSSLPFGLGSNDIGLDRGQLGETRLVEFEQAGPKLFLKQLNTDFRAVTDNEAEAASVTEAFASSILWGFKVVDSGESWVLVDATEFLLQDIHGVGRRLTSQKQGKSYTVDKSRSAIDLSHSKAFPDNTELRATVTLKGTEPGNFVRDTVPNPYAITLKMQHSFIRLPEAGYETRPYLPKSGIWSLQYMDYATAINENITQKHIRRHRLKKQQPGAAKSKAVEPIIYYLDPGVPEPVRSALLDGARWWNSAFEEIGYDDAFQVKILPEGADPMDVRYNVIQWVHRSTRGWSYGRSVTDPRTGEIIKGHVTLGSLRVRQDYLIAQGMMAPFASGENDQALMDLALARIRQLSAHEVGHTLGLRHNFAASGYGRESVMDYPAPKFELGKRNQTVIAPDAYGVGLGKWDKAAIAYAYREFNSKADERQELTSMIQKNDAQGLLYISDADSRGAGAAHADSSLWDNGENAVEELSRLIKVREVAIGNFGSANLKDGRDWSDLEEIFVPVYYSTRFQIHAAAKWLGGLRYDYGIKGENRSTPQLSVVDGDDQKQALGVLLETIQPEYLALDPKLTAMLVPKTVENRRTRESVNGKTGVSFDQLELATASAQHTLGLILNSERLARLVQQSSREKGIPSISDIGRQLHKVLLETSARVGIEREIQKATADLLISNYLNLVRNQDIPQSVRMQVYAQLVRERSFFAEQLERVQTSHPYFDLYSYQLNRLQDLDLNDTGEMIQLPKMPPGSPI